MVASTLSPLYGSNLSFCSSRRQNPCRPAHNSLNLSHFTLKTSLENGREKKSPRRLTVRAVTDKSQEDEGEESVPTWARLESDEPPPWAREEGGKGAARESFEIPFFVYLLASAITAIAAIGSVFEYVNQRPVFGVLGSDSIFYAPVLGFFAFTGIPTSAFLWFKSVQVANKEAEEQDRRDGYL
ncbi:hypothetical protein NMG60_11026471 [Bertholletia excelsa]